MLAGMLAAVALTALLGLSGTGQSTGLSTSLSPLGGSRLKGPVAVASVVNVNDEARLSLTQESESEDLDEAGQAKGTLPGHVRARLLVGADVKISFTVYPRGGSISGRGTAKIHGKGVYISFAGALQITRCTGRFAHMHGGGNVYGTLNRETDDSTVQVIGKLVR